MNYPVPAELLRSADAPPARTLVDIIADVVRRFPDSSALDNGVEVLTYAELFDAALEFAERLGEEGVRRGDRVGVRVTSGTTDLYVAILGILCAGACYVPVDAEDPDERARTVFESAGVAAVVGNGPAVVSTNSTPPAPDPMPIRGTMPAPDDDAWIIFTSGSTGAPKGVAVSHRNAAAFVDAEAGLFLQQAPLGPGDRVMAGLSVAFDASCEEIWLAWAHGACLVPAPRSLMRSGVDVGGWLVANGITVVSTVPTLVALWPTDALDRIRLLILGGEACSEELAQRLQQVGREVWNTYGPTEATVVACGALLTGEPPVRIGLPLAGWDLAVVDSDGHPVQPGEPGELIIGGVGLARYLDPALDEERYAPMPSLGWERAYRSGDVVRFDGHGLVFAGRIDDQIKLGGRRLELGEIDNQLLALPGVTSASAAIRETRSGNRILVGYIVPDASFDVDTALELLRSRLPATLVPRLALVESLPVRTSGKVDRNALPWPLPKARRSTELDGTAAWVAEIWNEILGAEVAAPTDNFFDFGGGSLTAAQVVSRLRTRFPGITVADLYESPTIARLAAVLDGLEQTSVPERRRVRPVPTSSQIVQAGALILLRSLGSLKWLAWIALTGATLADPLGVAWLPQPDLRWAVVLFALFVTPPGRMIVAAVLARVLLHGVSAGTFPRGGTVHLRLWFAEQIQDELGALGLAGAPFVTWYARLLGSRIGRGVDLHSVPPVTGMLTVGDTAAIEPEVDLRGFWVDGDRLLIGPMQIGAGARVGTRTTLAPGAEIRDGAEIAPGSLVVGRVPAGQYWSGSPASRQAKVARGPWTDEVPPRNALWLGWYALTAPVLAAIPIAGFGLAAIPALLASRTEDSPAAALVNALPWLVVGAPVGLALTALLVALLVRALGRRLEPGHYPVRSLSGWRIWATLRVLDEARTWLFPLYSSQATPLWLRSLGAQVGQGVEASTVLLLPGFAQINDQAFLADDTLIGCYELGGGWIRVERVKIGKRAFVGNSGMAAPGRKVPKESLVAVLSAAPARAEVSARTSWVGSPPTLLQRAPADADQSRTYSPPRRLRLLRGLVELARIIPLAAAVLLGAVVVAALAGLLAGGAAVLLSGPVLVLAGLIGALTAVAAKRVLVGRHRTSEHPLWSGMVWRNELADTFVEMIAAPWFANPTRGTGLLVWWLRRMGAHIGRGVWCETYWLPEPDLVHLGDGATINGGCVVQTHLFHDRVLSIDAVTLAEGATLGPNSVILPAAQIDQHATVGPVSLVMRGERVPERTRWTGNPIGPWVVEG